MKKRKNKVAMKRVSVFLMSVVMVLYFAVGVYSVKGESGVGTNQQNNTPINTPGGGTDTQGGDTGDGTETPGGGTETPGGGTGDGTETPGGGTETPGGGTGTGDGTGTGTGDGTGTGEGTGDGTTTEPEKPDVDDQNVDGNIRWTIVGDKLTFTSNGKGSEMLNHTTDKAPWLEGGIFTNVHEVVFDDTITNLGTGTLKFASSGNEKVKLDKVTIGKNVKMVPKDFCQNVDIGELVVEGASTSVGPSAFKECYVETFNLKNVTKAESINAHAIVSTMDGGSSSAITIGGVVGNSGSVAETYVKSINDSARKGDCLIGNDDGFVKFDSQDGSVTISLGYSNLPAYDAERHFCQIGSENLGESKKQFERAIGWEEKYKNKGTLHAMDIKGSIKDVYLPVPNEWLSRVDDIKVVTVNSLTDTIEEVDKEVKPVDGTQYILVKIAHHSPYGLYLPYGNGNGNIVASPVSSDSNDSDDDDSDDDDDDTTVIPNSGGNGPVNGIVGNNGAAAAVAGANAGNAAAALNAGAAGNVAQNAAAVQQQAANNVAGAAVNTNVLDDTPKTGKFPVLLFLAMVLALMGIGMMLITKPVSRTGFKK